MDPSELPSSDRTFGNAPNIVAITCRPTAVFIWASASRSSVKARLTAIQIVREDASPRSAGQRATEPLGSEPRIRVNRAAARALLCMMTYRQATRLFVTCMGVLCFVSFYTSKVGYQTTTKDGLIYWGMSFGGALFQFSTFWFLAEYFARGTRKERVRYGVIAGAICVLVFWFSTQWSVVSMGGKDALSTHMQRTLAAAEMQGLRLYGRAATEANLGPQLQTLSQNFTDLARRESGGAFSGLRGEGDVVATLRNTSELFANLAGSVDAADK